MYSPPPGMLTGAACTVYDKNWNVAIPQKLVKSETEGFCWTYRTINWTVVPRDRVQP